MARPSTCSILPAFFHRNSIVPIDCLVVDCLRSSSESPKSGRARRSQSMRSRGSKSFRFLQIISAANKQYAGAGAPDRQQNQLLPLVFRLYSALLLSLYSMLPPVFLYLLAAFAALQRLLLIFDIAAVCCDSRIVHWQEILSPSDCPLWLPRSNAALAMASIRFSGGLYFALFLYRNFS